MLASSPITPAHPLSSSKLLRPPVPAQCIARAFYRMWLVSADMIAHSWEETGNFPLRTDAAFFAAAKGAYLEAQSMLNAEGTVHQADALIADEDAQRAVILKRKWEGAEVLAALFKAHTEGYAKELEAFERANPRHAGYTEAPETPLDALLRSVALQPALQLRRLSDEAKLGAMMRDGAQASLLVSHIRPVAALKAAAAELKQYGKAAPAPGDETSGRRQSANCFGLCNTRAFLEGAVKAADATVAAAAEKSAASEAAQEVLAAARQAALVEARDGMVLTFAALKTEADVTLAVVAKIPMTRLAALIRLLSGDAENVTTKTMQGKRVALKAGDLQQMAVPYVARWIRDGRPTMPVNFGALEPSQGGSSTGAHITTPPE